MNFLSRTKVFLCLLFLFFLSSCLKPPSEGDLRKLFFDNEQVLTSLVKFMKTQKSPLIHIVKCRDENCYAIFPKDIRDFFLQNEVLKVECFKLNGKLSIEIVIYYGGLMHSESYKGLFYTDFPILKEDNYTKMPLRNGWFLFNFFI